MTLEQLENAFYGLPAESIERGEWAAFWMKLAERLGPLPADQEAAFLKERAAHLANLARTRRAQEVLPELDLANPAFKCAFDCVDAWCVPHFIKKCARRAHLLLLLGGVGNGKKSLASYAAAKLRNGGVNAATVPWSRISRVNSPHNVVYEHAEYGGVLIITDFSMGKKSWPNKKEDQATSLLDLIRARRKRYTLVTTAHTGNELAEVCRELHSAISSATNSMSALVRMDNVPNYTPKPQPEPEEQDMPF